MSNLKVWIQVWIRLAGSINVQDWLIVQDTIGRFIQVKDTGFTDLSWKVQDTCSPQFQDTCSPQVQDTCSTQVQDTCSPQVQDTFSPQFQDTCSPQV